MALEGTVLFPKTVMPLRISRPSHLKMLADVLAGDRTLAIANSKTSSCSDHHAIATMGLIRMSSRNPDGTSTVVVQGSERIRIKQIVSTVPYLVASVGTESNDGGRLSPHEDKLNRKRLLALVYTLIRVEKHDSNEFYQTCKELEDIEALLYFTLQACCDDASISQNLLETLDTKQSIEKVLLFFEKEIAAAQLRNDIAGKLQQVQASQN